MSIISKIKQFQFDIKRQYIVDSELSLKQIEKEHNIKFPLEYINFIRDIGVIRITEPVMAKSINPISNVTIEGNFLSVGRFFDWTNEDFSIRFFLDQYSDQIPINFIPFAEGELGDLIGFYYKNESDYNVSYWFHESTIGNAINKIANTFGDFINSLEKHEIKIDKADNIKHIGPSPKMIELLKKTGKWKGK